MDSNHILEIFDREMRCEYKGREYLARDNGAILRLPKEGSRISKWDNVWTFGTKDNVTGYMILTGGIRVHQVVCTAFHGPEPLPHMVVDHIDTNRCNNRPENLRWLTRLENALNNDATRKKIIFHCGSVKAFIENPGILRTKALPPDISWMRTVTKEEAAVCKKHIEEWSARDSTSSRSGKGFDERIFLDADESRMAKANNRPRYAGPYSSWKEHLSVIEAENRRIYEEQYGLKDSITPGAKQLNWKTRSEFPSCPREITSTPLQDYLSHLSKGAIYCRNQYSDSPVFDAAIAEDGCHLAVLSKISGVTNFALSEVTFEDGSFIHKSIRSFFTEDGAKKYFTLSLGKKWDGGDVMEDFC